MKEEIEVYPCLTCRGTGKRYIVRERENKTIYEPKQCNRCGGSGYMDWIDNIKYNKDGGYFTSENTLELPRIRCPFPRLVAEDLINVDPWVS